MNEHAPGWYEHNGERRYWDGTQWTHSTALPPRAGAGGGVVTPYTPPPTAYTPVPAQPGPGAYGPPPQAWGAGPPVARKEPWLALLVSFFIPGVGSMVNGDVGPGVGILGLYIFGIVLTVCLGVFLIGLIGVPISLGAWVWGMVHAYQGAVDYNRAAGYPG